MGRRNDAFVQLARWHLLPHAFADHCKWGDAYVQLDLGEAGVDDYDDVHALQLAPLAKQRLIPLRCPAIPHGP